MWYKINLNYRALIGGDIVLLIQDLIFILSYNCSIVTEKEKQNLWPVNSLIRENAIWFTAENDEWTFYELKLFTHTARFKFRD